MALFDLFLALRFIVNRHVHQVLDEGISTRKTGDP